MMFITKHAVLLMVTVVMALAGLSSTVSAYSQVRFSPDGKLFATSRMDDDTIEIWNVESGKLVKKLEATEFPQMSILVGFSSDAKQIVYLNGVTAFVWVTIATGKMKTVPIKSQWHFSSASDQLKIAIFTDHPERYVLLFDIRTGKLVRRLRHKPEGAACMVLSPAGDKLISAIEDGIKVTSVKTGKVKEIIDDGPDSAYSCAFASDAGTFLRGGAFDSKNPVMLTSLDKRTTSSPMDVFKALFTWSPNVGFAPNDPDVAFATDVAQIKGYNQSFSPIIVWNIRSGEVLLKYSLPYPFVETGAISPDGKSLMVLDLSGKATLIDIKSGVVVRTYSSQPQTTTIEKSQT